VKTTQDCETYTFMKTGRLYGIYGGKQSKIVVGNYESGLTLAGTLKAILGGGVMLLSPLSNTHHHYIFKGEGKQFFERIFSIYP